MASTIHEIRRRKRKQRLRELRRHAATALGSLWATPV